MTIVPRMLAAVECMALVAFPWIASCETPSNQPKPNNRFDAAVHADAAVQNDADVRGDAAARHDADAQDGSVQADAAVRADASVDMDAAISVDDASAGGANPRRLSIFLLAGQSNMLGNTDSTLFNSLLSELENGASSGLKTRLVEHLRHWYFETNNGYAKYGYSDTMAAFEASELIRLHKVGLVNSKMTSGHPKVLCTKDNAKVAPLALNCGNPFGPELVLGQVLGATPYAPTSLIKVAKGGTTLSADWRSPRSGGTIGPWYIELRSRIRQLKSDPASLHPACASEDCRWSAFIWFQGENDSFDLESAEAYGKNLRNLIADVRSEVGSPTLPVVIVKIGKWAQSLEHGSVVVAAQQSVVDADPYTRSVTTDDLSGFYHYDPAAQLIIGERVAHAVQALLP